MSTLDLAIVGTIETLDDLREDGRRRFMKRRTKEELEWIIVAAWRERDASREHKKVRTSATGLGLVETPAVKSCDQTSDSDRDDDLPVIKSMLDQIDSFENSEDDWHTLKSVSAVRPRKSAGSITTRKANGRCVPSSRWIQKRIAFQKPTRKRSELPEPKLSKKQSETFQHTETSNIAPRTSEQHVKSLPIVLYVPDNYEGIHYPRIEQLPFKVHTELKQRLDRHRNGSPFKAYAFQRLVNNPGFYEDRPYCVCDQVTRGLQAKEGGRPVRPQALEQGTRLSLRADDKCIRDGIPCTHIMKQDGEYVLCIVPLPKNAQKSANWKELGFWVQE